MLKKDIITKMKNHNQACISFKGLVSNQEVTNARQNFIDHCQKQVDSINGASMTIKKDSLEFNNGQFFFLPKYPRQGSLIVRSKDYVIDSIFCDFKNILPESYTESDLTWGFKTKAGNIIMFSK